MALDNTGMGMRIWTAAVASIVVGGCATTSATSTGVLTGVTLGLTRDNAIEVCEPRGEREYLARLICPSGQHPEFERRGSVGPRTPLPSNLSEVEEKKLLIAVMSTDAYVPGSPDYHWIDAYEVRCEAVKTTIYMDMYHCAANTPSSAPSGFTIAN